MTTCKNLRLNANIRNWAGSHWTEWDILEYPFDKNVIKEEVRAYLETCDEEHARVLVIWASNARRL